MIILGTNSIKDTGYDVANSCRFNDGSTDYLSISGSTPSNRKKFTYSFWFKRGELGTDQALLSYESDSNNRGQIQVGSGSAADTFRYFERSGGSNTIDLYTNRLFRDNSAFYNIILAVDTTQSTESNRVKIFINGVQETSFSTSTYPSQNYDTNANGTYAKNIGRRNVNGGYNLDGYLAEVVFVDGTQQANTDLGEFDEDSGIWKPIDVSGLTFGTNGFYLDFEDSSALGNDVSGNNNDWTANNLTAIDQSTDTCTNNFATMNPLDNYYANSTFSEGNLKYTQGSSRYAWNLSTIAVSSGKWYVEVKLTTSGANAYIGITDRSPVQNLNDILGSGAFDYGLHQANGDIFNNAGTNPANDDENYASSYASGDIIGIALDLDNNKLYFSKGGQWSNGSGAWDSTTFNSSTGAITITAPASTNNGNYFFAGGDYQSGASPTFEWNFGSPIISISSGNTDGNGYGNFEYAPPSGYYALCTKNLAEYG